MAPTTLEHILGGLLVACLGVLLLLWPKPVYWISDQTNLRAARTRAAKGHTYGIDNYDRSLTALRWAVPLFVILMGTVIMAGGFF